MEGPFRTEPAGKDLFVVDTALHPTHQMLNVSRRGHLRRSLVLLRILPEILESFHHVSSSP